MGRFSRIFILCSFLFTGVIFHSTAQENRILIRSSHSSPVIALKNIPDTPYIASVGSNGRILLLDTENGKTIHDFYCCDGTIKQTAVNRTTRDIAVVYEKKDRYYLTVWDWNREKEVFTRELEQEPILLTYSEDGTYLFISHIIPPYLLVYKSKTGKTCDDFESIRDSFLYLNIDSGGKNLTGYTTGGSLYIWRNFTSSGSMPFITSTIPEIQNLYQINSNGQSLFVGIYRDQLLLLDIEKGKDLYSYTHKNILAMTVFEKEKEVCVLSFDQDRYFIDFYSISNGIINPSVKPRQNIPSESQPLSLEVYNGVYYLGCENGEILSYDTSKSSWNNISFTPVMDSTDFSLNSNLMSISSEESIWIMQSLFFESDEPSIPLFQKNNQRTIRYPLENPDRVISLDSDNILLYRNNSSQEKTLVVYNVFKGRIRGTLNFKEEILDIIVTDRDFIVVRNDDEINKTAVSVINIETMTSRLNFYLPPYYRTAAVKGSRILVALDQYQNSTEAFLLHYDMKEQKEIEIINTNFRKIESLVYSAKNGNFYAYGEKQTFSGKERDHQIFIYPDDDLLKNVALIPTCSAAAGTELHMDEVYGHIYQLETPYSIIRTTPNGKRQTVLNTRQPVKSIAVRNSYLYLLMKDGSLRGYNYNQKGKSERFTLTIFKDNEWIINPENGQWIIPSQGVRLNPENYISVFEKVE